MLHVFNITFTVSDLLLALIMRHAIADIASLHCALAAAVYCNRSCLWLCVSVVCYHDNSKLSASILTKLGL